MTQQQPQALGIQLCLGAAETFCRITAPSGVSVNRMFHEIIVPAVAQIHLDCRYSFIQVAEFSAHVEGDFAILNTVALFAGFIKPARNTHTCPKL